MPGSLFASARCFGARHTSEDSPLPSPCARAKNKAKGELGAVGIATCRSRPFLLLRFLLLLRFAHAPPFDDARKKKLSSKPPSHQRLLGLLAPAQLAQPERGDVNSSARARHQDGRGEEALSWTEEEREGIKGEEGIIVQAALESQQAFESPTSKHLFPLNPDLSSFSPQKQNKNKKGRAIHPLHQPLLQEAHRVQRRHPGADLRDAVRTGGLARLHGAPDAGAAPVPAEEVRRDPQGHGQAPQRAHVPLRAARVPRGHQGAGAGRVAHRRDQAAEADAAGRDAAGALLLPRDDRAGAAAVLPPHRHRAGADRAAAAAAGPVAVPVRQLDGGGQGREPVRDGRHYARRRHRGGFLVSTFFELFFGALLVPPRSRPYYFRLVVVRSHRKRAFDESAPSREKKKELLLGATMGERRKKQRKREAKAKTHPLFCISSRKKQTFIRPASPRSTNSSR